MSGLVGKRLSAHEVGDVAQGLGDASGILRAEVVVVVPHDGVEMCPSRKDRSQGAKEGGGVSVFIKEGVLGFVRMHGCCGRFKNVTKVYKMSDPIQIGQGLKQPVVNVGRSEWRVGTGDCGDSGRHLLCGGRRLWGVGRSPPPVRRQGHRSP